MGRGAPAEVCSSFDTDYSLARHCWRRHVQRGGRRRRGRGDLRHRAVPRHAQRLGPGRLPPTHRHPRLRLGRHPDRRILHRAADLCALRPDAAAALPRLPGGRGSQLLPSRRRRCRRHVAGDVQGRVQRAAGPPARGRLDHHPAGGQERPLEQRRHRRPQAEGGGARHPAGADAVEGADPRAVPERDLAGWATAPTASAPPPTTTSASRSPTSPWPNAPTWRLCPRGRTTITR